MLLRDNKLLYSPTRPGATDAPSLSPTNSPSDIPSRTPTNVPTDLPSSYPSTSPSARSTVPPSRSPLAAGETFSPSPNATFSPSSSPLTIQPSRSPLATGETFAPTLSPSTSDGKAKGKGKGNGEGMMDGGTTEDQKGGLGGLFIIIAVIACCLCCVIFGVILCFMSKKRGWKTWIGDGGSDHSSEISMSETPTRERGLTGTLPTVETLDDNADIEERINVTCGNYAKLSNVLDGGGGTTEKGNYDTVAGMTPTAYDTVVEGTELQKQTGIYVGFNSVASKAPEINYSALGPRSEYGKLTPDAPRKAQPIVYSRLGVDEDADGLLLIFVVRFPCLCFSIFLRSLYFSSFLFFFLFGSCISLCSLSSSLHHSFFFSFAVFLFFFWSCCCGLHFSL